jgi:serine/threonine protein kinase
MSYHSIASSSHQGSMLNISFNREKLLPEKEVWRIFWDMARSIQHVHEKGFIHLDISPGNFFVTKDRTVKLGDFGKAVHIDKVD